MTQRMKRDRLAQPRGLRRVLEQPAELARGQMTVTTGKQPTLLWRNAGVTPFRTRLPPLPQQVEDLGGSITFRSLRPFDCTMRMII